MTIEDFALMMIRDQDESSLDTDYLEVVKEWTEEGIDELLLAHDWRELRRTKTFTTDTINSVYTIDAGVREIRAMRFKDTNIPIKYLDAEMLYSIAEDLEKTQKPHFWFWESSVFQSNDTQLKIQFNSIPDAAYVIEYLAIVDPLSLTSVNVNVPVQRQMFSAIKNFVRSKIYEQDGNDVQAASYLQQFYNGINRLMDKDNAKSASTPRLQPRDISNTRERRLATLDPDHF
jgi:hypothetical protein